MKPLSDEDELARLQFLHDRRMTLFNTRRDHEWKIFFGIIGLFLATDAAQLAYGNFVMGWHRWIWVVAIATFAGCCISWLKDLQDRNGRDRAALDEINKRVCESLGWNNEHPVWEHPVDGRWGWWTFLPQLVSLSLVAGLSAWLPFLGIVATCKH
jgi:hypothetical protein